jgi:tRNA(His) guanylyltransferase
MKDELGERMKENYENRTRILLPRRTYTLIRLDGKAFHTYTKEFTRPYDTVLMQVMDDTAVALCEEIQGAAMAFVQSDEISILLTDFVNIHTNAWFDGNIQKIVSVSASIATAAFNKEMLIAEQKKRSGTFDEYGLRNLIKSALFDSRTFSIPDREEVVNYFIWRQQDSTRNSIQMAAQSLYSQKQLHGKDTSELQEMMFQKGINWDKYPVGFKRGRMILREKSETVEVKNPRTPDENGKTVERVSWASFEPPIFTQERGYLLSRIPKTENP